MEANSLQLAVLTCAASTAASAAPVYAACADRSEILLYSYLLGALLLIQVALAAALIAYARRSRSSLTVQRVGADLTHNARLVLAGELTASIAHEIAQPLSAMLNNLETAELLLQQPAMTNAEALGPILSDIKRDNLRAQQIVNRLRGLLRKRELQLEPIDVNHLVGSAVALVRTDAERRQIQLRTEFEPDLPCIAADPVHLQQVVLNLLVNAMDAMSTTPPLSRWLHLRTRLRAGSAIEVTVRDNGLGIDPMHTDRVFDSFYTTKDGGMGLGLSIARSIVQAHGGTLRAESGGHGGSTFTLRLPLPQRHRTPRTRIEQLTTYGG